MVTRTLVPLVASVALTACWNFTDLEQQACERSGVCSADDAAVADAGSLDSGSLDAGSLDAAVPDAGSDAGAIDGGAFDAGRTDAGATDAGNDAGGANDAGAITDAGGVSDAGPPWFVSSSDVRVWSYLSAGLTSTAVSVAISCSNRKISWAGGYLGNGTNGDWDGFHWSTDGSGFEREAGGDLNVAIDSPPSNLLSPPLYYIDLVGLINDDGSVASVDRLSVRAPNSSFGISAAMLDPKVFSLSASVGSADAVVFGGSLRGPVVIAGTPTLVNPPALSAVLFFIVADSVTRVRVLGCSDHATSVRLAALKNLASRAAALLQTTCTTLEVVDFEIGTSSAYPANSFELSPHGGVSLVSFDLAIDAGVDWSYPLTSNASILGSGVGKLWVGSLIDAGLELQSVLLDGGSSTSSVIASGDAMTPVAITAARVNTMMVVGTVTRAITLLGAELAPQGASDGIIIGLTAEGAVYRAQLIGGPGADRLQSACSTSHGAVAIAGSTDQSFSVLGSDITSSNSLVYPFSIRLEQ